MKFLDYNGLNYFWTKIKSIFIIKPAGGTIGNVLGIDSTNNISWINPQVTGFNYKGTLSSVSALPTTGNTVGDVYLIITTDTSSLDYKTEYYWTGDTNGWLLFGHELVNITNTEIDTICV